MILQDQLFPLQLYNRDLALAAIAYDFPFISIYTITDLQLNSPMSWKTNGRYFTVYIDIGVEAPSTTAELCSLSIKGNLESTQFRQYQAMHWDQWTGAEWRKFQLKCFLPMVHSDDLIPKTGPFLYLVANVSATWQEAAAHCKDMGGWLFTLDSYEQWSILMNNVYYWYQHNHFYFWSSALVFLGIPKVGYNS